MVLVVSRSDLHFGFEHPFFPFQIGRTNNITRRRVGRLERKTKFLTASSLEIFATLYTGTLAIAADN